MYNRKYGDITACIAFYQVFCLIKETFLLRVSRT